jgi:hypothetical protein
MPEMTDGLDISSGSYALGWFHQVCDEKSSAARVLSQLYPGGAVCASCGQPINGRRALETFWRGDRTWCKSCETKFSPRAGTILADSHLTYAQYEILLLLVSLGHDQRTIATITGLHCDTIKAWIAKIKFRETAGA